MIIAFEGVDGAGKNTLVSAVEQELIAREVAVARAGFPRYEESVHAQLASAALHRNMGDLIDSTYGMATLFALDRAEVGEQLQELSDDGYVVLLDRFTASNAAYSAAREPDTSEQVIQWVADLEFDSLGIPVPDLHILVDVAADVAAERAEQREAEDASRTRDAYETDNGLQQRTVQAYSQLAHAQWYSPWEVVDSTDDNVSARAEAIANLITDMRR
ncbi:dTMP kinase [Corynebacterium falsenii]|uniref:dTMP kinase n=1 Tax=Corynebacterium falsenii TaxID=108486 RepID=UPI003FCF10B9